MENKTHKKLFTRQEIEQLAKNKYVASVSASTVMFTEEFKKLAYESKRLGVPVAETMRSCGIDPDVLGQSSIAGFTGTLNKQAKKDDGFSYGRKGNYRKPSKTGRETLEQRMRQLEHELAYTRQEVELLKKLQAADMEARRQWESKRPQK